KYPASFAPSKSAFEEKPYSGTRFSAAEKIAVCAGGNGAGSGWCSEWYEVREPLSVRSSGETLGEHGKERGTESRLLQTASGLPSLSFSCMAVIILSSHYGISFKPLCVGFYVRLKEHCKVDMSVGTKNPSSILEERSIPSEFQRPVI